MSEPTIRVESCRGDGRCPNCGAPSEFLHLLPCGCKPCMLWPCALEHLDRLLTESLRQLSEQRHPCPCGKDTASIKWARCYSCRQAYHTEMERAMAERDAAIRECTRARAAVLAANALADEVAVLVRRRVLDSRSPAADALLDYREPPSSPRADRMAVLEGRAEKAEAMLLKCEAVLDSYAVAWDAAPALLSEIREALPK